MLTASLVANFAFAADIEEATRISGFAQHQKEEKAIDKEREKGLAKYLSEVERSELERERGLAEYKRASKKKEMDENSPEYKQELIEKSRQAALTNQAYAAYLKSQKQQEADRRAVRSLLNEEVELDIYLNRPRYEIRKRAQYGAHSQWSQGALSGSMNSSVPSRGDFIPPSNDYQPPMPSFPDPVFDDFPPPPPPPPMNEGGDFGDFPPPPPPLDDFGF